MLARLAAAPFRLMLGLPAFYGLTVKSRVLQLLRKAGLYRGPINFVAMARPVHIGLKGGAVG